MGCVLSTLTNAFKVLDAYLHPKYPYMFFELSDKQVDDFAAFGTHSPNPNHNHSTSSLLPIATKDMPFELTRSLLFRCIYIFGDKNERRPLSMKCPDYQRLVRRQIIREGYPHFMEYVEKMEKGEHS